MYTVRLKNGQEFGPAAMDLILQWGREGRVPADATLVDDSGAEVPVLESPELARIIQAPPTALSGEIPDAAGGEGPALIPTKNPHALVGYYLGILALVPLVGPFAGIPAVILGSLGIRKVRQNPKVHGMAHAIIAIVLGAIGIIYNVTCMSMWFVAGFGP